MVGENCPCLDAVDVDTPTRKHLPQSLGACGIITVRSSTRFIVRFSRLGLSTRLDVTYVGPQGEVNR